MLDRWKLVTLADGTTIRVYEAPRYLVSDSQCLYPPGVLEDLYEAWERSPFPPTPGGYRLTKAGHEHARQQLLKERLRAKRAEL